MKKYIKSIKLLKHVANYNYNPTFVLFVLFVLYNKHSPYCRTRLRRSSSLASAGRNAVWLALIMLS